MPCPFNEVPTPVVLSLNPEVLITNKQDTFRAWRTVSTTLTNILRWLYDMQTFLCNVGRQVYSDASVPIGNTIGNTTTETAFASSYVIPSNSLSAGQSLRIKLYGVYNIAAGPETVEFKVKIGTQTVLDSGAVTLVPPMTNGGIAVDADLFVNSVGSAGSIEAQGVGQLGAPTSGSSINLTNIAPYVIDTTINEAITVTWQFTTANAGNNVTLRAMRVEVL